MNRVLHRTFILQVQKHWPLHINQHEKRNWNILENIETTKLWLDKVTNISLTLIFQPVIMTHHYNDCKDFRGIANILFMQKSFRWTFPIEICLFYPDFDHTTIFTRCLGLFPCCFMITSLTNLNKSMNQPSQKDLDDFSLSKFSLLITIPFHFNVGDHSFIEKDQEQFKNIHGLIWEFFKNFG